MSEFKTAFTLNAIGVRPATVDEAQELLFDGYWAVLLEAWADHDKLLITEDGSLFVTDAKGLATAQKTLDEVPEVWEQIMDIFEHHSMQAEGYNVQTAVALLAEGWRPSRND